MGTYLQDLKSFQVDLRARLNALERDWLCGRLASRIGVRKVAYHHQHPHRLIVEYDADLVRPATLLDFLDLCGVQPMRAPLFVAQPARRLDAAVPSEAL